MSMVKTAAAIALLLAPTGVVVGANLHEEGRAVEQHTSFVQIIVNEDQDRAPGYAAVAGLVSCEPTNRLDNAVLWFNDQLLFRKGRQGPDSSCLADRNVTHVWATEDHAPDPRGNPTLEATDRAFEFTDPNNRYWVVREYTYHLAHAARDVGLNASTGPIVDEASGQVPIDAMNATNATGNGSLRAPDLNHTVGAEAHAQVREGRFHTWVVEIKSPTLDPTLREHYNFVDVVDFAKLTFGPDGQTTHTGEPGDTRSGNSHNASAPDEEHRFPHDHDTADVQLWVGGAPEVQDDEEGTRVNMLAPADVDGPQGELGPLSVERKQ